ncbi:MAG: putative signal transducing protein [Vicinamibacterales bacterium]
MDEERAIEAEVIRVQGQLEAEHVLAALRANGIPARTRGEAAGKLYGLTLDGLGEVAILVPAEYAEAARELLAAGEAGQLAAPEGEQGEDGDGTEGS